MVETRPRVRSTGRVGLSGFYLTALPSTNVCRAMLSVVTQADVLDLLYP